MKKLFGGSFARERNTKLHIIHDSQRRPLNLFVTAPPLGRMPRIRLPGSGIRDDIGARAPCDNLPHVDWLLGDGGGDADWFRETLKGNGIGPVRG